MDEVIRGVHPLQSPAQRWRVKGIAAHDLRVAGGDSAGEQFRPAREAADAKTRVGNEMEQQAAADIASGTGK
jgi:hypothetical protein